MVYEVEHLHTKHRRALKVLRPDLAGSGEAVARLVREAGAAGRVESPFLAQTFDVGRLADGSPYLLMELLEGRTLRAELDLRGRLPPAEVARLGALLCQGLAAVHAAGIVHRDLKPENVFLVGDSLKIVDFGVMRFDGGEDTFGRLTRGGASAGTPRYMAPEQLAGGDVDGRADLYALGVLLYEAIAGRRPFDAADAGALLAAVGATDPPPLSALAPDTPPALEAAIHRALRPDPEARFPSARELGAALDPFVQAASSAGFAPPLPPSSPLCARFDFIRPLKSGGMGAVYEVVARETGRRRALKLMLPGALASEDLRSRFRLEARVAAGIDVDHVVDVIEAGACPVTGAPYLVMELLEGEDLGSLLARRGHLEGAEVVALLSQVGEALDRVHAAGVIHRDLKPENLFLTRRDDGPGRVKILDFGVAKVIADGAGSGVTVGPLGTPLYMAPEQLDATVVVGPAADRASLAHVAFTLLAGEPYWAAEARAGAMPLLAALARGPREPASLRAARSGVALSGGFDAWFARAVALDPAARFGSAAAEVRALAAALAEPSAAPRRSPPGRRAQAAGLAVIAVSLLSTGAWLSRPAVPAEAPLATPEPRPASTPFEAASALPPPAPPPPAPPPPASSSPPARRPPRAAPLPTTSVTSAPVAPPAPPPPPAHESAF